jgi:hypothetical protein
MADLIPDLKKIARRGVNPRTPGDLLGGERYRLVLCPELNGDRGVLVVQMTMQFFFEDGVGETGPAKGQKLAWAQAEKDKFVLGFFDAVKDVWNNKFRITTDSTVPAEPFRDVGVQFEFKSIIGGWDPSDDYELTVVKIDSGWRGSATSTALQNADLDSEDLTPAEKGASMKQRGAPHEFGHMLGLLDEYLPKGFFDGLSGYTKHWQGDTDSIMHSGEMLRPRHYAPFADWLTDQFAVAARLSKKPIVFKVQDTVTGTGWDMSNSRLS